MVPKTFLSRLAEALPVVVVQEHWYQLEEFPSLQPPESYYLELGGHRFSLAPAVEVGELERRYRQLQEPEIFEIKKKFIEERLHQEIQTQEKMQQYVGKNQLLQFIVSELFPLFLGDTEKDVEALLRGEKVQYTGGQQRVKEILYGNDDPQVTVTPAEVERLKEELRRELRKEAPVQVKMPAAEPGGYLKAPERDPAENPGQKIVMQKTDEERIDLLLGAFLKKKKPQTVAVDEDKSLDAMLAGYKNKQIPTNPNNPLGLNLQNERFPIFVYDALIQNNPKEAPVEPREPPKPRGELSMLSKLIGGSDWAVLFGRVYSLQPVAEVRPGETFIKIGKVNYLTFGPGTELETLEKRLGEQLEQKFKVEAVDEFGEQLTKIQAIRAKNKRLNLDHLDPQKGIELDNKVGCLVHDGSYYVYVCVPKFAMKHPYREEYYGFPACRVGVSVSLGRNDLPQVPDHAVVIDAYAHPFLKGKGAFQHLCDMTQRTPPGNLSPAEQIAMKLQDAQNIFMNGMTIESFNSHSGRDITDSQYYFEILAERLKGKEMSKKEALEAGYVITNELWKYVDRGDKNYRNRR